MVEELNKQASETQPSKSTNVSQIGKTRMQELRRRNPELTEKAHQLVIEVIKARRQDSTSQELNLDMDI